MKWPIIALLAVGIVAAGAASAIVAAFGARDNDSGPTEVEIVVAAKDLPAMTVVRGDMLTTRTALIAEAPEQHLTNPVQVIGRVLAVKLTEGQAVTRHSFSADGSGVQLAAALEEGMRAVSISLTDYSGLYGLLYPGSVVDVMAYIKLHGSQQQPASVTIMKAVQVLGVEDQTIVSAHKDEDLTSPEGARGSGKRWMITLMVSPKHAQALQLAMENGRLSLAMRNPLDNSIDSRHESTFLGDLLRPSVTADKNLEQIWGALGIVPGQQKLTALSSQESPESQQWEIKIIRGREAEMVAFPMGEDDPATVTVREGVQP